jgi:putative solute:sodium symporter small subunit
MTTLMPDEPPRSPEKTAAAQVPQNARESHRAYWRHNLCLVAVLLAIWFVVSYGCAILWVDFLDRYRIPGTGFKLGFWFAQQGSIYCFILLIGVYVLLMNRLDRQHGVDEES